MYAVKGADDKSKPKGICMTIGDFFLSILKSLNPCYRAGLREGKHAWVFLQIVYFIVLLIIRARVAAGDWYRTKSWPGMAMCNDLNVHKDEDWVLAQETAYEKGLHTNYTDCMVNEITLRISAGVFATFLIFFLCAIFGAGHFAVSRLFLVKLTLPLILAGAFQYLPDNVFEVVEIIFAVCSVIAFIFLQVFVINFAVKWNDLWTDNSLEDKKNGKSGKVWLLALVIFSFLFFVYSVVVTGYYASLTKWDFKTENLTHVFNLIVASWVLNFLLLILSLFSRIKHGSLLVSTVVMAYIATLGWGAAVRSGQIEVIQNTEEPVPFQFDIYEVPVLRDAIGYQVMMLLWMVVALVTVAREEKAVAGKDGPNEINLGVNNLEGREEDEVEKKDTHLDFDLINQYQLKIKNLQMKKKKYLTCPQSYSLCFILLSLVHLEHSLIMMLILEKTNYCSKIRKTNKISYFGVI